MNAAALLLAIAFAFPNEQGTRLIATGTITKPDGVRTALCSRNQQVSVQFERRQTESQRSSGRQTPRNFTNTAGAVFRIINGTISSDNTCVLTEDSFLTGTTIVKLARPSAGARCAKSNYPTFQADKSRPVVGCWPIAEAPDGTQIAIIEFSRRLTQALASLVLIDGDRRMYIDYPAEFKGPGDDLWRADDGGEIHADGFEVVFLLKRGSTYTIAINWAGAEGNALSVHTADGGGQFKEVISDSWYRSPI